MAEDGGGLLEVDADASEEDGGRGAFAGLVGFGGRVDRDEGEVLAHAAEFGGERVVAEAGAAVHAGGAGGEGEDFHGVGAPVRGGCARKRGPARAPAADQGVRPPIEFVAGTDI